MDSSEEKYNLTGVAQFYEIMSNKDRWTIYYLLEEANRKPEEIAELLEGEKENNMIEVHHKHIAVLEKSGLLEDTTPGISVPASNAYQTRVKHYFQKFLNYNIGHTPVLDEFKSEEAAEISKVLSEPLRIEVLTEMEGSSRSIFDYETILDIIDEKYPDNNIDHHENIITELHHKHFPVLGRYGVLDYKEGNIVDYTPPIYTRKAIQFESEAMK